MNLQQNQLHREQQQIMDFLCCQWYYRQHLKLIHLLHRLKHQYEYHPFKYSCSTYNPSYTKPTPVKAKKQQLCKRCNAKVNKNKRKKVGPVRIQYQNGEHIKSQEKNYIKNIKYTTSKYTIPSTKSFLIGSLVCIDKTLFICNLKIVFFDVMLLKCCQ